VLAILAIVFEHCPAIIAIDINRVNWWRNEWKFWHDIHHMRWCDAPAECLITSVIVHDTRWAARIAHDTPKPFQTVDASGLPGAPLVARNSAPLASKLQYAMGIEPVTPATTLRTFRRVWER
jgi:hypothetical protein